MASATKNPTVTEAQKKQWQEMLGKPFRWED